MNYSIACSIRFFKIINFETLLNFNGFDLHEKSEAFLKDFNNEKFIDFNGQSRITPFLNSPYFIMAIKNTELDLEFERASSFTRSLMVDLLWFMSFLWLIKDNSSSLNEMHLFNITAGTSINMPNEQLYTTASGEIQVGEFSQDEIMEAISLLKRYFLFRSSIYKIEIKKNVRHQLRVLTKENRVDRAFNFLEIARISQKIEIKISSYMSFFECLFTSDRSNISHTVSERIAAYIGGNELQRTFNYKIMKKAYDVRSKYLHGSEIAIKTKDPNYYTDLSVRVDQFARIILKRIITVYKDNFIIQHAKIFESYFEYLVSNPSGAEND